MRTGRQDNNKEDDKMYEFAQGESVTDGRGFRHDREGINGLADELFKNQIQATDAEIEENNRKYRLCWLIGIGCAWYAKKKGGGV